MDYDLDRNSQNHTDYTRPHAERRVVITYKNMPVAHHVSHIGLGVSALNTSKVLRDNSILCDVWPILGAKDLAAKIAAAKVAGNPPTHVVICAPWIPTLDLQAYLIFRYPEIHFTVICHSNVAFLSADPTAIRHFREELNLEQGALNFKAAGNNRRFCDHVLRSYGRPCMYLPNLYHLDHNVPRQHRLWSGGKLKIGSFGAVRPLKNHLSAAAAALELSDRLHTDVDFHLSVGRIEGGSTVVRSIEEMLKNSPAVKLIKDEWYQWPNFRHIVRSMHLLIQPSFTETFNMVTADGASESIPSVVGSAIEWAPDQWKVDVDNPIEIGRTARHLLMDPEAGADGFNALIDHNRRGLRAWKGWLAA